MLNLFDNKVHLVYGEKGSGKTTLSAYIADRAFKKDDLYVYSNYPLKTSFKITLDDLRTKRIPPNSVICIDEAASEINCRDWRSTGTELLQFIQQIRHFQVTAYIFSQSVNALDNQITELCDDAILCTKLIFGFSKYTFARKILKTNGRCKFEITPYNSFYIFRKKYYDYFDTHYISKELEKREFVKNVKWEDVNG